jgi:hypothetical protein
MNNMKSNKKELSPNQRDELLAALKARFEKDMARHQSLVWAKVQARLEANPEKLWSLAEMERTGGEPDVVNQTRSYIFGWRGQFTPEFVARDLREADSRIFSAQSLRQQPSSIRTSLPVKRPRFRPLLRPRQTTWPSSTSWGSS